MYIPPSQVAPVAYRLSWSPGDYCFYTPDNYEKEIYKGSASCWGLYETAQLDLLDSPAVYFGTHFVQPKYLRGGIVPEGFIPLYLGPILNQPKMGYEAAMLFPDMADEELKREKPHLFEKKDQP